MDYEKLVGKIASLSGLAKEEIDNRVEAKRAKLSGLISKEGAAQVVAAELGISSGSERSKIAELSSGMKRVNVVGKIITLFPVRNFTKNGQQGSVANMVVADDTSNIKTVLWDESHINLIKKGEISEGSVVEVSNASVRGSELHLGSFSEIKLSKDVFSEVRTERIFKEKRISELELSENIFVRAFIVQAFEPRFFEVCPECKKRVKNEASGFFCEEHKKVVPEKRAVMSMVLDDGTGSIRAVLFSNAIENIFGKESNDLRKEIIIGKEMVFHGNIRTNKFFNEPEIIVEKAEKVDLDGLIAKLEKLGSK